MSKPRALVLILGLAIAGIIVGFRLVSQPQQPNAGAAGSNPCAALEAEIGKLIDPAQKSIMQPSLDRCKESWNVK